MSNSSDDIFDIERLRQLVELMEDHGLSEVDLEQDEQRIRLRRGTTGEVQYVAQPAAPAPLPQAAPAPAPVAAASPESDSIVTINSPMVGTFYCKPNPDSEPFVKVGDSVGVDTVVCIVEAMKVFNEIQAEVSGQVVAVLVENDEAVDFGKPLFKVDTSK